MLTILIFPVSDTSGDSPVLPSFEDIEAAAGSDEGSMSSECELDDENLSGTVQFHHSDSLSGYLTIKYQLHICMVINTISKITYDTWYILSGDYP